MYVPPNRAPFPFAGIASQRGICSRHEREPRLRATHLEPTSTASATSSAAAKKLSDASQVEIVRMILTIPFTVELPISFPMYSFHQILLLSHLQVLRSAKESALRREGVKMASRLPRNLQAPDPKRATSSRSSRPSATLLISLGLSRLHRMEPSCPFGGLALVGAMCPSTKGGTSMPMPSPRNQEGAAPADQRTYGH